MIWLISALWVWHALDRGWVAHDEGALAQSAERVLQGEIPHRDFDEIYTGGLSYLNAAAFQVFGTRLFSMRLPLYAGFLLWVPLFFYASSRFASPLGAGLATVVAVVWSLPNYPAAVPSWYNLFLATATIAALYRYLESERVVWLFCGGLAAGLSCLLKIVGLYSVAAAILALLFIEQTSTLPVSSTRRRRVVLYSLLVTTGGVLLIAALFAMVRARMGAQEALHFILPGSLVAGAIVAEELRRHWSTERERIRRTWALLWPFLLGLLLPLVGIWLFFLLHDGVGEFVEGMLVRPLLRLNFAAKRPPAIVLAVPTLLGAGLLVGAGRAGKRGERLALVVLGAIFLAILARPESLLGYQLAWQAAYNAPPVVVLLGGVLLSTRRSDTTQLRRRQLMVAISALAIGALIQFPFSAPIYFAYVAPLLVLATLATRAVEAQVPRSLLLTVAGFYIVFAVARVTPGFIYNMGHSSGPDEQTGRLSLERGGLRVRPEEAREYQQLVALVRSHASGQFIYAGPDAPEVYFLSGLRNPTRTLFDFFDGQKEGPDRLLDLLNSHQVASVVVNSAPPFSPGLPAALRDSLAARYPYSSSIGRFLVRWR